MIWFDVGVRRKTFVEYVGDDIRRVEIKEGRLYEDQYQ